MVIGGAGYVGTELCEVLIRHGHEVVIVDPMWFGDHFDYDVEVKRESSFDLEGADYEGVDVVVHLGGMSNDPMADYDPARNFILNQALVSHAAFLARHAGVHRFVFASTCSVYETSGGAVCDESAPTRCVSGYSSSKLGGEQGLLAIADESFSVITLRKGTVCGHSRRMRFDLLLNTMVINAITTGTVTVNDPAAWRPILGIGDAVRAYCAAIAAPSSLTGVFNIASENVRILAAAEIVVEELTRRLGRTIDLEVLDRPDARSYQADITRAREVLGFAPRDTVRSIIDDVIGHAPSYGDVDEPNYYNIRAFKLLASQYLI